METKEAVDRLTQRWKTRSWRSRCRPMSGKRRRRRRGSMKHRKDAAGKPARQVRPVGAIFYGRCFLPLRVRV